MVGCKEGSLRMREGDMIPVLNSDLNSDSKATKSGADFQAEGRESRVDQSA